VEAPGHAVGQVEHVVAGEGRIADPVEGKCVDIGVAACRADDRTSAVNTWPGRMSFLHARQELSAQSRPLTDTREVARNVTWERALQIPADGLAPRSGSARLTQSATWAGDPSRVALL
jgi:hypothetical protein